MLRSIRLAVSVSLAMLLMGGSAWGQRSSHDTTNAPPDLLSDDLLDHGDLSGYEGWDGCRTDHGLGGDCCRGACCPSWVFRAGTLILNRASPPRSTSAPLLVAMDDFGWNGGFDVFLARHFNATDSIEARHFAITGWNYGYVIRETPGVGDDFLSVDYDSRIYSTEVNFRRKYADDLALLVGFRWIELHESFDAEAGEITGSTFNVEEGISIATSNYLYGAQTGADVVVWNRGGPFRIEGFGKGGIYGNHATNSASSFDIGGPVGSDANRAGQVAFVGDVALSGVYRINDCLLFRAGYQLLWVEGIALANEQFPLDVASPFNSINSTDGVFYHGVQIGGEMTY